MLKHLMLPLAAALTLVGCSDNWKGGEDEPAASTKGKINLASMRVEVNPNITTIAKAAPKSRATYDLGSFNISVTDAAGATVGSWTYASMQGLLELNAGTYTVTAVSDLAPAAAAWEAPLYRGSKDVTVEAGTVKDLGTITCNLANLKVSVRYSDELLDAIGADNATVDVKVNQSDALTFVPGETRSGYFNLNDDSNSMVAEFAGKVNGSDLSMRQVISDNIKPGYHHIITFGVRKPVTPDPDPTGSGDIEIVIDTTIVDENVGTEVDVDEDTEDPGKRPGSGEDDDPEPGPGPDPEPTGPIQFSSDTFDLNGVNDADDFGVGKKPAVVNIHSDYPIANLMVKITSNTLTKEELESMGLSNEFDLANPGEYEAGLSALGFPVGATVLGQNDVTFDITTFMLPLSALGTSQNIFDITLTDNQGNTKGISLRINVK